MYDEIWTGRCDRVLCFCRYFFFQGAVAIRGKLGVAKPTPTAGMVAGCETDNTGFGRSSEMGDGRTDIMVDVINQTVDGISFEYFLEAQE